MTKSVSYGRLQLVMAEKWLSCGFMIKMFKSMNFQNLKKKKSVVKHVNALSYAE